MTAGLSRGGMMDWFSTDVDLELFIANWTVSSPRG
jgi:hypothetical protein